MRPIDSDVVIRNLAVLERDLVGVKSMIVWLWTNIFATMEN